MSDSDKRVLAGLILDSLARLDRWQEWTWQMARVPRYFFDIRPPATANQLNLSGGPPHPAAAPAHVLPRQGWVDDPRCAPPKRCGQIQIDGLIRPIGGAPHEPGWWEELSREELVRLLDYFRRDIVLYREHARRVEQQLTAEQRVTFFAPVTALMV